MPAFSMAQYWNPVFCLSFCPFVGQSINICVYPNLDSNVQVHFPRTIKATVMILGISLHLGTTSQTAVSVFDHNLYFMVHRLCKFTWRNIAFGRILIVVFFFRTKSMKLVFLHENICCGYSLEVPQ